MKDTSTGKDKLKWIRQDATFMLLKRLFLPFLKLRYKTEIKNNDLRDETKPFVLLANHLTADDPVIIDIFTERHIRYIVADTNYDTLWKKIVLSVLGNIKFSKRNNDLRAVREIKELVSNGYPVGIFPEGGRTWNGETEEIIESTAKLVKKLGVNVYTVLIEGGYFIKPRWAQFYRKGKIFLDFSRLFEEEEIKKLSVQEINIRIKERLEHNEYVWQKENMQPYKGKYKAEYIQRLLYMCPKCHGIDCIESRNNNFFCGICGVRWKINDYGLIQGDYYDNTVDWDKWQKESVLEHIDYNTHTVNTESIKMFKYYKGKKIYENFPEVVLNKNSITITDENESIKIDLKKISAVSITMMDIMEFYDNENIKYRLVFNPVKNCSINMFYDLLKYFIRER